MKSEKSKGLAEKCQKKRSSAKTDSGGAKIVRTTCTAEIDSLFDSLKKVKNDEPSLQSEKQSKQIKNPH